MTSRTANYTNAAQQRILALVLYLFGDVANGYRPAALAQALGCSASAMTRDLDNLRTAGLAEYVEQTCCWRLTSRLPNQAAKVYAAAATQARQFDHLAHHFN